MLAEHVFWDDVRERKVDAFGAVVDDGEPLRWWGLGNYRTIDDQVSDALRIARVS